MKEVSQSAAFRKGHALSDEAQDINPAPTPTVKLEINGFTLDGRHQALPLDFVSATDAPRTSLVPS